MSAEKLEQTLLQLLVPDNDVIKQATAELKLLMSDAAVVPVLCNLLCVSANVQVRQYAGLLLRRKFLKSKQWNSVPADIRNRIRESLLELILQEPDKLVQKSVCQLIATLAKHDLPNNRWPSLFQFLDKYTRSDSAAHREVGSFVLSCIASVAHEQLKPQMSAVVVLCDSLLSEQQNHRVAFYAIQTLTSIVQSIDSNCQKSYENLMSKVIQVIRQLTTIDENLAADAFQVFDELAECEISVLQPHIKATVQFCLEVAANSSLSCKVRVKALSFISTITRQKKKAIVKLSLIGPILSTLFPIMCDCSSDPDSELHDAESHTPSSVASQVVDVMALHLPPEKFIPALMKHVEPALTSLETSQRRAAYLAIAVASEGCADYMKTKLLSQLLRQVYAGMSDDSSEVRNSAMFALGQFSEHLQPDISKYSTELLPLLFDCLSKTSHDTVTSQMTSHDPVTSQMTSQGQRPKDIVRVYYALEMFVENLGKDILPYLAQLMDFLLNAVNYGTNSSAKSLAISAIGATANAAGDDILPYFPQILDALKQFLSVTETEEQLKVQIDAIDALSVLARKLGSHFRPLATECVEFGLTLLKDNNDPDLRRCLYSLFGSLSTILKQEMSQYLEVIVLSMIYSIKSTEGITAHYSEQDAQVLQIFSDSMDDGSEDDVTDETDTDEEETLNQEISVENSFVEEKEDACSVLGELAINTGPAFIPYVESTYAAVSELLEYPSSDIRQAAVKSLGQICCAIWHLNNEDQSTPMSMLTVAVGKMLIMVRRDDDRQVAMAILETLNNMLNDIKQPVLKCVERTDVIISVIKDVFQQKMSCQDAEDDELDDEQAEYDSALIENAGELLPTLAKLLGGATFAPYFAGMLPEILKKLKKSSKVPEKSFAIGTISETIDAMGDATSHFVNALYPVVMATVLDDDEEVRSNAVFGLGVLAANGGSNILPKYTEILKTIFELLSRETDRRCVDNMCAALCRMIVANTDSVPVDQVFPVILQHLPLQEDIAEELTIYKCIAHLYSRQHPQVMSRLPEVIVNIGDLLANSNTADDLRLLLNGFILDVSQNYPDLLRLALTSANHSAAASLQAGIPQ